jgi:NitT/TauT family transport system substrate-binding protein
MIRRRSFLKGAAGAGVGTLFGFPARRVAAEPPPETTTIRLFQNLTACEAPQAMAAELLRAEGFTDVQYLKKTASDIEAAYTSGEIQIGVRYSAPAIIRIDAGAPYAILGGIHVGCLELFASERIRTIRDLKGRKAVVNGMGSAAHIFFSTMVAHVGLDPQKDVDWVNAPASDWPRLLLEGKGDAFLHFPPYSLELRAQKAYRVLLNTATDRPWSQYFCCMVVANRDWVTKHPVATKRATRALLKATDLCALEPERVAQKLVERGYMKRRELALQMLRELPYGRWREYIPEDTIRFYALRLHEVGMIKSSPQKILAQGTNWRFFNELKKELKG